jgi:chemotaxis protein MotB
MQEAKKEVEETMKQEEVAGEVKMTKDGLVISLQEQGPNVFFESGSAEMSEQMKKILDELAPTLNKLAAKNHDVIVEGHTDDVPTRGGRYPSNWELSSARATNVVQYLLHQQNFPPKHIAAVGYGENKNLPRETEEDTASWRQRNRRVVFLVKNPDNPVAKADGPPTEPEKHE